MKVQDALKENYNASETILHCRLTTFSLCTWTCCTWGRLCVGGLRRKEKTENEESTCKKGLLPFFCVSMQLIHLRGWVPAKQSLNLLQNICARDGRIWLLWISSAFTNLLPPATSLSHITFPRRWIIRAKHIGRGNCICTSVIIFYCIAGKASGEFNLCLFRLCVVRGFEWWIYAPTGSYRKHKENTPLSMEVNFTGTKWIKGHKIQLLISDRILQNELVRSLLSPAPHWLYPLPCR